MMINYTELSSQIKENSILLLMVSKEGYRSQNIEIARALSENAQKSCYVCINAPYNFVTQNLAKNNISIDKFFFIDTLTRNVNEPAPAENCIFVSSPNSLTEISLAFSKALNEKHCDGALFDTISSLTIYQSSHTIIQFVHTILTKLRITNGKAIFVVLKDDINSDLVKDLYMFVDKVVDLSESAKV